MGLSMMFHADAPASLWFDVFAMTFYVINTLHSSILHDKSPFELLFCSVSNYSNFKLFGCHFFLYLQDYAAHKLEPCSRPCIFLGYSNIYKGFRCLAPKSSRYSPHIMLSLTSNIFPSLVHHCNLARII